MNQHLNEWHSDVEAWVKLCGLVKLQKIGYTIHLHLVNHMYTYIIYEAAQRRRILYVES